LKNWWKIIFLSPLKFMNKHIKYFFCHKAYIYNFRYQTISFLKDCLQGAQSYKYNINDQ
jgi:hypothetical protein